MQSHIISVDVRILNRTDTILVIQRMPDDVAGIYISNNLPLLPISTLFGFWLCSLFFCNALPIVWRLASSNVVEKK